MRLSARLLPLVLSLIALVICVTAGVSIAQSSNLDVTGMTRPSEERKLSFSGPGVVQYAPVKEGDRIKAGDFILGLDDSIDKLELDRLKLEADSKARVEAAEADLKVKEAKVKRMELGGPDAYNEAEREEAANDVVLREKQLQVAKEDREEARIKSEQQAKKVEKLHINSPIDGLIQRIVVNVGEWADPQSREGAIMVVKNDPVYVEVREVNARLVGLMKIGQKMQVRYPDEADKADNWHEAEVFFMAPVAESVQTRLFKLRLANPSNRPAGLEVIVRLPAELAAANAESSVAGK